MSLVCINDDFISWCVSPKELDELLAQGWRHFGVYFFRYSVTYHDKKVYHVMPLRIRLENFSLTKSLRRILRRNSDLDYKIRPAEFNEEKMLLFDLHKTRFKRNVPSSLYDFLSPIPSIPCQVMEISVFLDGALVAASFFDVGQESISSIYAMFDPKESVRSLGIFTMLLEINFAIESGKKFFYQGYAYEEQSFYDYKKRFRGTEKYDWQTQQWKSLR